MSYRGDYDTSTVIYGKFTTFRPSTGAPFALAGTPALSVYKDNSTTQSTAGVTLTADFDTVTGLNHFAIDTSADGTFYSAGSNFDIVITTGTVDSVSVVGSVVASFSLRKDSAIKPTTAGRTLDVSAGGEAGVDWANIGSPTTAVNLSATNIDVDQVVASVSGAVGSVTGAVGSVTGAVGSVTGAVGSVTGNVGGNVTGSVGSVAADGITSSSLAASAGTEIAAAVWADASRTLTALDEDTTTIDLDASIRAAVGLASANLDTQLDALPTNAELNARTLVSADYATASELSAVRAVTDKLDTTLVITAGSPGEYEFTADALRNAPTGSGGDCPTASEIATEVWVTATRTLTSIDEDSTTLDLDATIRAAVGLAAANLDTQLGDLPTATENADALLNRDMSAVSDSNSRSPLNALRFIRNKWDVAAGTLTVKKEDDSTTAWTATVSTSAGADPIVGNDPA